MSSTRVYYNYDDKKVSKNAQFIEKFLTLNIYYNVG